MQFEKKKSILRYLGKDGKDVRALDRMIKQGKVVYDGTYYSVKGDGVEDKNKNENLEDIENFSSQGKTVSSKVDVNNSELEFYKGNMEYYKYISEEIYGRLVSEIKRFLVEKRIFQTTINELLSNLEAIKKEVEADADRTGGVR